MARGVGYVLVVAGVWEGVGCEGLVGREVRGWSGLVWVGVMVGAWVEPICACLVSGECIDMRAWGVGFGGAGGGSVV